MPPAQMHGDTTGGVEWFVSTDGTDAGGTTIRVTELTNYLSSSPVYTLTSLPVTQYQNATTADQPGLPGGVTTFPNTTMTQVQYRNGKLVTAMDSGLAGDGFTYPKGLYYEIDVSSGSPVLVLQGVIDPGTGVAVQLPSVDIDNNGDLGFTWMESSLSEYLSMWVGTLDTKGNFASVPAAPGGGFFYESARIGDYSTTVLDPNGTTFWSANEYIGSDGAFDIWRTHLASFTLPPLAENWYSQDNLPQGATINLATTTPSDGPYAFGNTLSPHLQVFDANGNLLASGTKTSDGRNETLSFTVPAAGTYYIEVSGDNGSQGEYFLDKTTVPPVVIVKGTVFADNNDNHVQDSGEPGQSGVAIYLDGVYATSTDSNGNYSLIFYQGNHTITEAIPAGYINSTPTTGAISITPASGLYLTGQNFGNAPVYYTIDDSTGLPYFGTMGTGWTSYGAGYLGESLTHAALTTAHGAAAIWDFKTSASVGTATYEIYVSYQSFSNSDPNARYIISDPVSKTNYTVYVSQLAAPVGGSFSGVLWQDLGSYSLTFDATHHLFPMVRLFADKGGTVDADGAMLVQISTPAIPKKKSAEGSSHQVLGQVLAPNLADVLASGAMSLNHGALLASIFSSGSHDNGTAAVVSNHQPSGVAGMTSKGLAALVSERQLTYLQAIELAFGGRQSAKAHLDGLWAALELDPAAVLAE
jgi:hypothetical protein